MIKDMNLDGLPEVLLRLKRTMGTRYKSTYEIFSWDGSSFKSLVSQTEFDDDYGLGGVWRGDIRINGLGGEYPWEGEAWEVLDIDQNGTLELILRSGIETHEDFIVHGPHQPLVHVYTWNGEGFVLDDLQIGPPEYRFQAVHNGDLYTLLHEYEQAETSYRQAIDDPTLLYWIDNSVEYFREVRVASYGQLPTPTPSAPDVDEYPNLATYAQYRIVLLHLLQGQMHAAEEEYQAILAGYPAGQEGHIFVLLAKRLLGEYRASGDVRAACGEVVEFAAMHEDEVLQYVGGYHGWQSLEYEVADVCPFR
jgi:tetratricopeptide (TPR) repeat protein